MMITSDEILKNVDTTLGLMKTYEELGTTPISRFTLEKLFKSPVIANSEFTEVAYDLKTAIGNVPFNAEILYKKIPKIHPAFARNLIQYMRGQGLVEEEGHNNRVKFI